MNNFQWITTVKQQAYDKSYWQFIVQDASGKQIIFEWHMADITSPILAAFKKEVADLAARTTAASEVEFLHRYPEAVNQEMFLKSCAPLFAQGFDNVDWSAVEKTIQATIKQFYCTDISAFGEQMIKMLSNDVYFFARTQEEKTGKLLGFCMLAITPNLPYGDIKLINCVVEPTAQHRSIERLLLGSLFAIIKPQRIFTAIRSTNTQAQEVLMFCGFMVDNNPKQDPNHALNLTYFTIMEYKANDRGDLQMIAKVIG